MKRELNLLVEGWRDIPHSYSLVLCFQLLELAKRPHLRLSFRQVPYFNPKWQAQSLFSPAERTVLEGIPAPAPGRVDVVYRAGYPFDFSAAPGNAPVLVFATTEFRKIPDDCPHDFSRLATDRVTITSPSHWSAAPFVECGATPVVLPHGVDATKFHPLSSEQRAGARQALGIQPEHFVFVHIGSMTPNKGILPLLKAFLHIVPKHPHVRLALKGLGSLYASRSRMQEHLTALAASPVQRTQLLERLMFIDSALDFASMNQLYNASDCYLAPYYGEGFALPVIEALACDLPVLVSNGGATDDYVTEPLFRIPTQVRRVPHNGSTIVDCGVDNIAGKMQDVLSRPDDYRRAAATLGASIRDQYSWAKIVDQLEDTFARLAGA